MAAKSARFTQADLDRLAAGQRGPAPQRLSAAQGRRLLAGLPPEASPAPKPTGSKLRNQPTVYAGHRYDSKAEANYARKLDLLQRAGLVTAWQAHVVYQLAVAGLHICSYELDFLVTYPDGRVEHVDVKGQRSGVPYRLFQAKQRLMLACHGIEVLEVKG